MSAGCVAAVGAWSGGGRHPIGCRPALMLRSGCRGWLLRRCRLGRGALVGGPAVFEGVDDTGDHGWGDMAVDTADAGEPVPESFGLGYLGNVVIDEPGFVGVAE